MRAKIGQEFVGWQVDVQGLERSIYEAKTLRPIVKCIPDFDGEGAQGRCRPAKNDARHSGPTDFDSSMFDRWRERRAGKFRWSRMKEIGSVSTEPEIVRDCRW